MNLKKETKSQRDYLTTSDRHMLKAFFAYVPVTPTTTTKTTTTGAKREKADACSYVQSVLWPPGLTTDEQNVENAPFVLETFLQPVVPSIFAHTVGSLQTLFNRGGRMNDREQTSIIRSFQHFNRMYTNDLPVRNGGYARVFVSGSVSETDVYTYTRTKRQTNRQTEIDRYR